MPDYEVDRSEINGTNWDLNNADFDLNNMQLDISCLANTYKDIIANTKLFGVETVHGSESVTKRTSPMSMTAKSPPSPPASRVGNWYWNRIAPSKFVSRYYHAPKASWGLLTSCIFGR